MPFGSSEAAWSEPHIDAIERDVTLDAAGAERDRGDGRGQTGLVTGVADRHAVAIAQRLDDARLSSG